MPKSSPACKKRQNKFESGDEIVDNKNKVDGLIQSFNMTKILIWISCLNYRDHVNENRIENMEEYESRNSVNHRPFHL